MLEEFLGRRDRAADALDRLADEAGDLAGRFVLDHVLDVVGTLHVAGRILEAERAAVAVAGVRVVHVRAVVRLEFPGALRGEAHRHATCRRDSRCAARSRPGCR